LPNIANKYFFFVFFLSTQPQLIVSTKSMETLKIMLTCIYVFLDMTPFLFVNKRKGRLFFI
jgi:hypothetical protein